MNIVNFPESNKVYKAPKDTPEVLDLPVFDAEGLKISCWQFTPTERLQAIFTNKVWLHVHQDTQPPVLLSTEYPFHSQKEMEAETVPIEKKVEMMIERKIDLFFAKELTDNKEFEELCESGKNEFKKFLVRYTKDIFEFPTEEI